MSLFPLHITQLFNRAIFDEAELFHWNSETDKVHLARCWGCSNVSFNAVEKCFSELCFFKTPISVFPCFSKILEHIIFTHFPRYLWVSKIGLVWLGFSTWPFNWPLYYSNCHQIHIFFIREKFTRKSASNIQKH